MSIHTESKKVTLKGLCKMKGREPIVMITAYDALFASIFDEQVDMILVGDSLNMSFYGKKDTLSATLEQMIYHTNAVSRGAKRSFILFDMPFGTYTSKDEALKNAIRVYQETSADAIKIEGDINSAEIVEHLTKNGIAVVAHIGLKPQSIRADGGYIIRGKDEEDREKLLKDAKALEKAGAFMVLLEGMKSDIATEITKTLSVPTMGIGAGVGTDGQVLVWSDMFGFFEDFKPKFVKRYLDGASLIREALAKYSQEVKSGSFPDDDYSY